MSIKVMVMVWNEKATRGSDRLVLLALADNCNDDGVCWPSLKTIASKANLSVKRVTTALDRLEWAGYITRTQRKEKDGNYLSTLYSLLYNDWIEASGKILEGYANHFGDSTKSLTPEAMNRLSHGKEQNRGMKGLSQGGVKSLSEGVMNGNSVKPPLEPPLEPPVKCVEEIKIDEVSSSSPQAGSWEVQPASPAAEESPEDYFERVHRPPPDEKKLAVAPLTKENYQERIRGAVEGYYAKVSGKDPAVENFLGSLPEGQRLLGRAFCEKFGRAPLSKSEEKLWRSGLSELYSLGLRDDEVREACDYMTANRLTIKSPASVRAIAESRRREKQTVPVLPNRRYYNSAGEQIS